LSAIQAWLLLMVKTPDFLMGPTFSDIHPSGSAAAESALWPLIHSEPQGLGWKKQTHHPTEIISHLLWLCLLGLNSSHLVAIHLGPEVDTLLLK
jgi:hypothetical protein